jgi:hypothetical protein
MIPPEKHVLCVSLSKGGGEAVRAVTVEQAVRAVKSVR